MFFIFNFFDSFTIHIKIALAPTNRSLEIDWAAGLAFAKEMKLLISKKERLFGLKFSLINFSFASFLLFISSYLNIPAFFLISFSLILVSLGTASFLPTSTDIVFRIAPSNKKGFALALLSQCFAMGYFLSFISGRILDVSGHASYIWLSISFACFIIFAILFKRLF